MGCEVRPFGELFAEQPRNGLTRPKAIRGAGVKMVNMGELFSYPRLRYTPMDRVPLNDLETDRFLLIEGDLLFARQSLVLEGAGKCSIFLKDKEPVTFESHVTRVRLSKEKTDPKYYFYYFQSHHGRAAIRSIVEQGAGASGIRGSDLKMLDVLWRPVHEQRAIAHILGTLDDKIELNRRMNETLEAMARALFKSWFVNFDPVRAKAEGRWKRGQSLPGLPAHLYDLFPDSFEDSELGEIPKGWEIGKLGDLVRNIVNRIQPSEYTESFPYVPIECISARKICLYDYQCGKNAQSSLVTFKKGDILFGAMRPYFHKVCFAPFDGTTRTTAFVLRPEESELGFAIFVVSMDETIDYATAHSEGSTIPYAKWIGSLEAFPVILPQNGLQRQFHNEVWPLLDKTIKEIYESRKLENIRDTLLPKLISGDLRVKDADKFIMRVAS